MNTPTLINLPPPPSDPATPSEMPGTPTSTTTSMSELSTVAIKDGHRGHPHHHHARDKTQPTSSLEAERADRISRLAGLERVATSRQSSGASMGVGASAAHPQGYFDAPVPPPPFAKERSTVGSASATGSVGGHTTWASGSDHYDAATDKMSEDMEDADSTEEDDGADGFSDEGNASLVGFGEGASSTVSGPVSAPPGMRTPQRQSATSSKGNPPFGYGRLGEQYPQPPVQSFTPHYPRDPRVIDGMTYDDGVVDTANATPPAVVAERAHHDDYDPEDVGMDDVSDPGSQPGRYGYDRER